MSVRRILLAAGCVSLALQAQAADSRLRQIFYDPTTVVTVPVRRGVVTLIELGRDEAIAEVGTGIGADCSKSEAAWCVAAQPGGRTLFIKPKGNASAANNLTVVTDRRTHAFRLTLVDGPAAQPVYRLVVEAPPRAPSPAPTPPPPLPSLVGTAATTPNAREVTADRLDAFPKVINSDYSIADGDASDDFIPSLIFDDARFTYLRFAGNRELPAVFAVLGDGSETLVNTRMEGDLLVVDRVTRRLVLRAGAAVVAIWNDAFDAEGRPPIEGVTVDGVRRVSRNGGSR